MPQHEQISPAELISQAGYADARANFMHLVLQCAIDSLRHAELELSKQWPNFCAKDGALRPPQKRSKDINLRPDENAITYELGDYIHTYLRGLVSDHRYRAVHFVFEQPKPSAKLAGSKRKRLDLRWQAYIDGGPEFVVEAKPLFTQRDIETRYLGDEGLGRFTRAEEAFTEDELGALLGYVQQDPNSDWSASIRTAVSDGKCDLIVDVDLGWEKTYSTKHGRDVAFPPMWILHLLIRYPVPPAASPTPPKAKMSKVARSRTKPTNSPRPI
ncbi:hypothetical protein [Pandoraea commovens]|uniref:Uncharacterized protein n=1 Tax=Pandoraea commovens TaxID=2508289 RepID=A0ABY5QJH3_9BURK|nr:hypothetical protein [Pandoraea commovens]UVA79988.1 hypothetical protein NTU39_02845 [Pandoraea commovens]